MGATGRDILTLVFKQGLLPVGIGLTIGSVAALAVTPLLKTQLVGVSPTDPVALAVAAATLVTSAALGCLIPACPRRTRRSRRRTQARMRVGGLNVRELWRQIGARLRRSSLDREIDEELQFHLAMKAGGTGDPEAAARVRHHAALARARARRVGLAVARRCALGCPLRTASVPAAARFHGHGSGDAGARDWRQRRGVHAHQRKPVPRLSACRRDEPHRVPAVLAGRVVSGFQDWREQARSFDGQLAVVFIGGNRTRLDDQRGPSEMYDATELSANAFRVWIRNRSSDGISHRRTRRRAPRR